VIRACRRRGARFSVTVRMNPSVRRAIEPTATGRCSTSKPTTVATPWSSRSSPT